MMFYIPGRFGKQCARGKLNQPRGSSALHSLGPLDHLLATINRAPLSQQAPRDMAAPPPPPQDAQTEPKAGQRPHPCGRHLEPSR